MLYVLEVHVECLARDRHTEDAPGIFFPEILTIFCAMYDTFFGLFGFYSARLFTQTFRDVEALNLVNCVCFG